VKEEHLEKRQQHQEEKQQNLRHHLKERLEVQFQKNQLLQVREHQPQDREEQYQPQHHQEQHQQQNNGPEHQAPHREQYQEQHQEQHQEDQNETLDFLEALERAKEQSKLDCGVDEFPQALGLTEEQSAFSCELDVENSSRACEIDVHDSADNTEAMNRARELSLKDIPLLEPGDFEIPEELDPIEREQHEIYLRIQIERMRKQKG